MRLSDAGDTAGKALHDADRGRRGAGRPERSARVRKASIVIVTIAVALDQLTKSWAASRLARGPVSIVGSTVELRLTRNPGSAFSVVTSAAPFLAVLAVILSIVLVRMVRRSPDTWTVVALSLVLGGAFGNLCDRIFRAPGVLRGAVVDFVHVGWWPSFNVADSCISVGAVMLVVAAFRAAPTRP